MPKNKTARDTGMSWQPAKSKKGHLQNKYVLDMALLNIINFYIKEETGGSVRQGKREQTSF